MALPMLVNNADCGPSNPLQGLSKRFDQDRGIQQDHFGASRAGSSREVFRTANNSLAHDQDASRFFSSASSPPPLQQQLSPGPSAFHLGGLKDALPAAPTHKSPSPLVAPSGWASDFMLNNSAQMQSSGSFSPVEAQAMHASTSTMATPSPVSAQMNMRQWNPTFQAFQGPQFMPHMPMQANMQQQSHTPLSQTDQVSWDREFMSLETPLQQQPVEQQQNKPSVQSEGDELSRTAGLLLDNVRNEANPKFQKSAFLGLMKQLRDREVIVEGNQMIENPNPGMTSTENANIKGKGREVNVPLQSSSASGGQWNDILQQNSNNLVNALEGSMRAVTEHNLNQQSTDFNASTAEDANDAYFRQENEDYMRFWREVQDRRQQDAARLQSQANAPDWGHLQDAWDELEQTDAGIRSVSNYQFQENNPYLLGDSSTRTRHHGLHNGMSMFESVLELEAAVQRNPTSAHAWYELGVKQQENEREQKAILALKRAVSLDPSHIASWLALAVSLTNDSDRVGTYESIKEWVQRNDKYRDAVQRYWASQQQGEEGKTMTEKFNDLVQCLITMARSAPENSIDADVQIALAVILNTIDDYGRSQDCFQAALAVRPNDWLLYNRVGATMANSGHSEDALQYYHRALELNPSYIRARYNLGISCINLLRYEEAAQHVLDALALQDSDGVVDASGRDVTSDALWDTLKTCCLHLGHADLAGLCERRDLDTFRAKFTQG